MEKLKEYLNIYINYLEKNGINVTSEEMIISNTIETSPELRDIVPVLKNASNKESRLEIVNKFIEQKKLEKKSEEDRIKAALEKKFGIDLTEIDHMKLQSGIDIIGFYDNRLGRKRLIDYSYAKSLVEEFTNIQNNSTNFQTEDEKANSNEIAEQEANQNNNKRELDMIDIERFKSEYDELIKRIPNMDSKKIQSINELLRESEVKNIKYINIENMLALDDKNNIIESHYNEKKGEVELNIPERLDSKVENVNNEELVDQTISDVTSQIDESNNNQVDVNPTDYELEEEIVSAEDIDLENEMKICNIEGHPYDVLENIKWYEANMDKLDNDYANNRITKEEFEFYEMMCEKYKKQITMKKTMVKTLEYDSNSDTKGIISTTLISILAMGLAILLAYLIV